MEPVLRILNKSHRIKLIEIYAVLGSTAALFYYLKEDMLMFGIYVYIGLIYVVSSSINFKTSCINGFVSGAIGAATEHWGCSQGLWNWVDPSFNAMDRSTKSLWMVNGAPHGYPVEVVVAYAGAGFWMTSISLSVLSAEHEEMKNIINRKQSWYQTLYKQLFNFLQQNTMFCYTFMVLLVALKMLILFEPAYLQSSSLLLIGSLLTVLLPSTNIKIATLGWAIITGIAGLFFEIYATGGFLPESAVWRYNHEIQRNIVEQGNFQIRVLFLLTAPLSAFPAYVGTGLIIFSLSFWITAYGNTKQVQNLKVA
jgi:hypothetical protein